MRWCAFTKSACANSHQSAPACPQAGCENRAEDSPALMPHRARLLTLGALLLIGMATRVVLAGEDARALIAQGNADYAAGRYAAALEKYTQAQQAAGGQYAAELLNNQAAAEFKLGRAETAREHWARVASMKDAAFEAQARYNIGNCHYADALQRAQAAATPTPKPGSSGADVPGILRALDSAAAEYGDAIRLDPHLANARANLELAELLKKKIKEQTSSQPSSQGAQSQSSSQPQSQPQSSSAPTSQQGEQQPSSQPQDSQDQQSKQDQQKQDSQDAQSQPASQESQPQEESPQSQPATPPESQPASQPEEAQEQPAAESQPADENEDQPNDKIKLTRAQAERLFQIVRDMEKQRRALLLRREAAKQKPVDKDW
jgi:Ca-activated chloride channel homolog